MSDTRKIMRLDLSAEKPTNDGYYYAELLLPAEEYEIRDAMQQLRAVGKEESIWISILECEDLPELENIRLDSPTLDELNFFVKRLASLGYEEQLALYAVIDRIIPENYEGELVSMKDLINTTYGLDTVMIAASVANDEQLGQFAIENEMQDILKGVPDNALYLLDKKQIGKLQRESDGGVFVDGFYVVAGEYEMPEVYDGKTLPETEVEDWFAFRLQITPAPKEDVSEVEDQAVWISLPIQRQEADRIAAELGADRIEDCVYLDFISSVPQITAEQFGNMQDFSKLNALAEKMPYLSPIDQVKFKAVLSAEQPKGISEVLDIVKNLGQYEFDSVPDTSDQFFKIYLNHHMDTRFDREWLDKLLTQNEGDKLLERLSASVTDYGVISARGRSLYELVPYREPEVKELTAQTMTDEKLDVIELLDRKALFSNGRLTDADIPQGLYCYHLRHSDDGDHFCSIEPKVGVNHGGTVITKEPINFGKQGYISFTEDTEPNFLSEEMTIKEFAETDMDEDTEMQMGGMQL